MSKLKQTPSQTVGPFFAYGLCPEQYNYDFKSLFTPNMADHRVAGEHVSIIGNVYDGAGNAVGDAIIEMMQADSSGQYVTDSARARESGFSGFARAGTGTDPGYQFVVRTVKPGSLDSTSAPHIDVIVHMRGMLLHAYTRIYFEDEGARNANDAVLASVPLARRSTLLARRESGKSLPVYRFDIHLQGPLETVFFDL